MPGTKNGDFFGPRGFLELWGSPAPASSTKISRDPSVARELWQITERLTGIEYDFVGGNGPVSGAAPLDRAREGAELDAPR
jgi:hypothetical protein